uniref:Uncharacterized protein n=1 Tax=Arundo donax TaxID=35708 RepID=A0A0A9H345_ARUDO
MDDPPVEMVITYHKAKLSHGNQKSCHHPDRPRHCPHYHPHPHRLRHCPHPHHPRHYPHHHHHCPHHCQEIHRGDTEGARFQMRGSLARVPR